MRWIGWNSLVNRSIGTTVDKLGVLKGVGTTDLDELGVGTTAVDVLEVGRTAVVLKSLTRDVIIFSVRFL